MSDFICPECSYEGNEPICPYCSVACESLKIKDDVTGEVEKYPQDLVEKTEKEDDVEDEESSAEDQPKDQ